MFDFTYIDSSITKVYVKLDDINKASGVDSLPTGLLKDSAKEIAIPLTHIINLSISKSTWKV